MVFRVLTTFLLIAAASLGPAPRGAAQDLGPGVDARAIAELQSFIFDDVARRAYANGDARAKSANDFVEAFPPWATQEILEIMMMCMRESGAGAIKHADAYSGGGTGGARGSFSPAVNARIDALIARLKADPGFNDPKNLQRMQQKMPALPTKGS